MLDWIGDALGAIVSGGATGLLGAGISLFGEIKKQKMVFDHEENMSRLNREAMQAEAEMKIKVATTEGAVKVELGEMEAFKESIKNDFASYTKGQDLTSAQKWLMVIVDFLRGMIRPSMTLYMALLTTLIYVEVMNKVGGLESLLNQDAALALANQIILVILYITSTVILWWFGTRQKIIQPPGGSGK
jgi:hypothetical protein